MKTKELIKKCKKNNKKAQSELFYRYKDKLFALCLKYCKNREEAEDNLQDSFLAIFKKIGQYDNRGSFEGWMKRITINLAIDRYRKEIFVPYEIKDDLTADVTIEINQLNLSMHELLSLIQELPNKYRLVFSLYELDNYSHQEISEMLQISVSASKSNLHRAKRILKEKIQNRYPYQKKIAVHEG